MSVHVIKTWVLAPVEADTSLAHAIAAIARS